MRAGTLRHRITVQQPSFTKDDQGSMVESWVNLGTYWGSIIPVSGKEAAEASTTEATVSHKIIMRFTGGVLSPRCRLMNDGRVYNIVSVRNSAERNIKYEIDAVEVEEYPEPPQEEITPGDLGARQWFSGRTSRLWTDAGVTLVTADQDPVRRAEDVGLDTDSWQSNDEPSRMVYEADFYGPGLHAISGSVTGLAPLLGTINLPQPYEVWAAVDKDSAAEPQRAYGGIVSASPLFQRQSGQWQIYAGKFVGGGSPDVTPIVCGALYDGANSRMWIDGVEVTLVPDSDVGANAYRGVRLCANGTGTLPWVGQMSDFAAFDAALTDEDRAGLTKYLGSGQGREVVFGG